MSLTEKWIKKMRYIHTMEYYLAIKKSEIMPFGWILRLSYYVKSDREVEISYDILYMWNLKKNDTN